MVFFRYFTVFCTTVIDKFEEFITLSSCFYVAEPYLTTNILFKFCSYSSEVAGTTELYSVLGVHQLILWTDSKKYF